MPENEKNRTPLRSPRACVWQGIMQMCPSPGRMSPEQEEQIITRTENALQGERHTLRRMRD